ncbi:MAG TPA: pentapeptide repeat-containing protein [Saprospiraceae bacterium]|nr:pentapeptide repeat-containing protein [Saprospiraceae bacterium]
MKQQLINRWNNSDNLLDIIKTNSSGFSDDLVDLKGLPFGSKKLRTNLQNIKMSWIDFSYSNFEECNFTNNTFANCIFNYVTFVELRQWNCKYINCTFIYADFRNATLGLDTSFDGCIFKKCKLQGKYFDFGTQNKFINCDFINCNIQSAWILSITFENCIFSSKFLNVRFSGSKEADLRNQHVKNTYPATLLNCKMIDSIFKGVEIMDGAIIKNTLFPDQKSERFNNDRIYYE